MIKINYQSFGKGKYQEAAIEWAGSVFGLVLYMDNKPKESPEAITVSEFIHLVHHIPYEKLRMADITPAFINGIFDRVDNTRKGKGMCYVSKILHSMITKAEGEGLLKVEAGANCNERIDAFS